MTIFKYSIYNFVWAGGSLERSTLYLDIPDETAYIKFTALPIVDNLKLTIIYNESQTNEFLLRWAGIWRTYTLDVTPPLKKLVASGELSSHVVQPGDVVNVTIQVNDDYELPVKSVKITIIEPLDKLDDFNEVEDGKYVASLNSSNLELGNHTITLRINKEGYYSQQIEKTLTVNKPIEEDEAETETIDAPDDEEQRGISGFPYASVLVGVISATTILFIQRKMRMRED